MAGAGSFMKTCTITAAMLCILCSANLVCADQSTNSDQIKIKNTIVAIQNQVEDLTDPLEPLFCKEFVAARKSMSRNTAVQIVKLIRQRALTTVQSDIGVLLLSGLNERTYWVVTEQLLTTNTEDEVLDSILNPPLPYGPGYANSFKVQVFYKKLHALEAAAQCGPSAKVDLNMILSGEASRIYADYLKHPDRYGYRSPNDYNGNQ